ncbi:MAG: hypothetical protein LBL18_05905 [Bacteroidales bacterium]|jgi:hypothetical protein|nr:hypothetical protein [Bacteroidales bacterium]
MKKKFFLALSVAVVASGAIFFACSKEEKANEDKGNSKSAVVDSKQQINNLSKEVAEIHDYVIQAYLADLYKSTDIFDEKYMNTVNPFIKASIQNYPFKYAKIEDFNDYTLQFFTYQDIRNILSNGYNYSKYIKFESKADLSVIEKKCSIIEKKFQELFYVSSTLQEFETEYYAFVEKEIGSINNLDTYASIRFFADMYMSSFKTWCTYIYSGNEKSSGWWDKVKKTAASVWNEIRPVVVADAAGAAVGALAGCAPALATAGLSVPGAALAGACLGSIDAGIGQL